MAESSGKWNWVGFAAGILVVIGIGTCLGVAVLGWWWLRPDQEARWTPPLRVRTPALVQPSAGGDVGATRVPSPMALSPRESVTSPTSPGGATASPAPAGGGAVPAAPTATPVPPAPPTPATPPNTPAPLVMEDLSIWQSAETFEEVLGSPAGRPIVVTFREDTLNEDLDLLLEQARSQVPPEVKDVDVWLRPEGVYVRAALSLGGVEAPAQVLATLAAGDCRLTVQVKEVRLAGLPAPAFLRRQVEDAIAQYVTPWLQTLPVCVEAVVLEPGAATFHARK
ncbi:MAG: hypothetical protein ACUVXG_13220 [Anaerolineae bacterium]